MLYSLLIPGPILRVEALLCRVDKLVGSDFKVLFPSVCTIYPSVHVLR